jgi:hypothetical protein
MELDEKGGEEIGQLRMSPELVAGGDKPALRQADLVPQYFAVSRFSHGREKNSSGTVGSG